MAHVVVVGEEKGAHAEPGFKSPAVWVHFLGLNVVRIEVGEAEDGEQDCKCEEYGIEGLERHSEIKGVGLSPWW